VIKARRDAAVQGRRPHAKPREVRYNDFSRIATQIGWRKSGLWIKADRAKQLFGDR